MSENPTPFTIPPAWSEHARFVYEERLGIATDLGQSTEPGTDAHYVAVGEAWRANAGVLTTAPSRGGCAFTAACRAFPIVGSTDLGPRPKKEKPPEPQRAERGGGIEERG